MLLKDLKIFYLTSKLVTNFVTKKLFKRQISYLSLVQVIRNNLKFTSYFILVPQSI